MDQVALTKREKNQSRKLLKTLYRNSIIVTRMDIDNMGVEEAKRVWRLLEPYRSHVASVASGRKRDMDHIKVLNMMRAIQDKAEGGR